MASAAVWKKVTGLKLKEKASARAAGETNIIVKTRKTNPAVVSDFFIGFGSIVS